MEGNPPIACSSALFRITYLYFRFIPKAVAEKYDLDIPDYPGVEQIAEVSNTGTRTESKKEKIVELAERQP